MKFDELFTKLKVNPLKLIESIVHADGSSVILFKNRKSEILYVNDQFYQKHPQFKNNKEAVIGKTDFDLFPDSIIMMAIRLLHIQENIRYMIVKEKQSVFLLLQKI